MNLNDLYKKVSVIPIGDFPPSALSGLLHGYISIYSIVRVNPWLEDVYGSQWDIHERIREIAGELADLIQDPSIALEDRVGYIADLMETYLTYSDMDFLDIALDAAYGIISPEGRDEIVLPCRTPEMCRLLCSCYYFTGEEECMELAKSIIKEWGNEQNFNVLALWRIVRAIEFYNNVADIEEKIGLRMELFEERFSRENSDKFEDVVLYFEILSVKSYEKI